MSFEEKNEEPQSAEEFDERVVGQPVVPTFTYYTYLLIACLIAAFLAQTATDGLDAIASGGGLSTAFAGFDKMNFRNGEYWRILTAAAVHGGILHLFFNCYALYVLGQLVEVLSNRAHLAIVFLLSVISGGVFSLIFLPDIPSVGASGGIIGFLGYLTVYGFKRRRLLPEGFLKNMLFNIGFIAFIGLFLMDKVDNFGHLGGLLTGLIYGLVQIPGDLYQDPREVRPVTEGAGMIAIGLFVFTSIFAILVILQFIKF